MFERFAVAGKAAWALVGVGVALAVVLWIFWQFRVVFPVVVLAGAMVFIFNPVVTGLARRGVPRAGGTTITYVGFIGIFVLFGFLVAPLVQRQSEDLAEQWPEIRTDLEDRLDSLSQRSKDDNWPIEVPNTDELRDQLGGGTTDAEKVEFDSVVSNASAALDEAGKPVIAADLDRVAADARTQFPGETGIAEQLNTVFEIGTRIFEIGLIFVIGPIIAFYMLIDLPHIGAVSRRLVPARAQPQVFHVAHRLNHTIGGYFRGQLAVAIIVGAMVSLGLGILGLPFWLLVGMIAGIFNMIPLIGPWVGAIPGVAIAITTRDFGTALWVVAIMTGAQQIDNHFISPLVMRRTTSLHPAVVMLALLAGASLGGFFGLLLAVPLTAALKVMIGHLWRVYVLEQPLDQVLADVDLVEGRDTPAVLEPLEHYVDNTLGESSDEPAADGADEATTVS